MAFDRSATTEPLKGILERVTELGRKVLVPLIAFVTPLASCGDGPTVVTLDPLDVVPAEAAFPSPGGVPDLAVARTGESFVEVTWTQVDDGSGMPARYEVRYATPPIEWSTAEPACEPDEGSWTIGAPLSCTVEGLAPETDYEFLLLSYRLQGNGRANPRYSNIAAGTTTAATATPAEPDAGTVDDLAVAVATDSSLSVRWTQVDDGTGLPASYRVKYALPPISWSSAAIGCDGTGEGTEIGATLSCTISGLPSGTAYDVQLTAFREVDGVWQGATPSNVATGTVAADTVVTDTIPTDTVTDRGMWVSLSRLRQLPMSGSAWQNVLATADGSCGTVDLSNQDQTTNVCVMAKALVFARTGDSRYRADVVSAIREIVSAPTYDGRALALGRELAAYVIAADLIGLDSYDPTLDASFRTELRELRTTYTWGSASSLIDCHERRPNNWGAHCGATRVAIAVYLGDDVDLARAAQVFRGYLGDRSSYSGFRYGGPSGEEDLSWQCDPTRPVGINPAGCTRNGLSLDGVLPDDQRRGGSFTTSPPKENYVWEAMQGLLAQAVLLERAGFDPFEWEDRALLRSARWLHDVNDYPAEGDDTWQAPLLNHVYGTSFPEQRPTRPGKNVGWTDWTHS